MPVRNRVGVVAPSRRVKVTEVAGSAFAFFETNRRPVDVAAQRVEASPGARSTAATEPPAFDAPYVADVSRPAGDASPSFTQSPQSLFGSGPNHVLHSARKVARSRVPIPHVFVRQTWLSPAYIVLLTRGSVRIGM